MTNEHLDDEAISAHLDGEATPAEAAHIEGCEACSARLAELRAASVALGAPLSVDATRRETAIAAALDALPSNVVPLAPRRARFTGGLPSWLGVAAAVLVIAAVVPLFLRGGDDTDELATGGDAAQEEAAEGETFDANTEMRLTAPAVDGGDVGAVDEDVVRRLVEESIAGQQPVAEAAPVEGTGEASGGAADEQVPAPCEDRARADFPEMGALRYRALGTYEGTDVSILVFELPTETPRVRALALDADDCGSIRFVLELATS